MGFRRRSTRSPRSAAARIATARRFPTRCPRSLHNSRGPGAATLVFLLRGTRAHAPRLGPRPVGLMVRRTVTHGPRRAALTLLLFFGCRRDALVPAASSSKEVDLKPVDSWDGLDLAPPKQFAVCETVARWGPKTKRLGSFAGGARLMSRGTCRTNCAGTSLLPTERDHANSRVAYCLGPQFSRLNSERLLLRSPRFYPHPKGRTRDFGPQ